MLCRVFYGMDSDEVYQYRKVCPLTSTGRLVSEIECSELARGRQTCNASRSCGIIAKSNQLGDLGNQQRLNI